MPLDAARFDEPAGRSTFVGRQAELDHASARLRETSLLTITGPGGGGKTRLALELASREAAREAELCADGVFAAFLAPLRDSSLVLATIARALDVREDGGRPALDMLAERLDGRRVLVVVDNLEHLPGAGGELSRLLGACPGLTIVATSRARLGIEHETDLPLPPLRLDEGVALLCERARVEPTDEVCELARRLEGLPLAIELAAARLALLTPAQLLERLGRRLDLLRTGDDDPRHETLRATIQWSYDLLSAEEQRALRALSVFVGGCATEAARAVAGADVQVLDALADKSLLRRTETTTGLRYSMLETIREFAAHALERAGELGAARSRLLRHFSRLAEQIAPPRYGDHDHEHQLLFEADAANFEWALSIAIDERDGATALRLVRCLGDYLYWWSATAQTLGLLRGALDLPGGDAVDRAHALHRASRIAGHLARVQDFRELSRACEDAFAGLGDDRNVFETVQERCYFELATLHLEQALREGERALRLAERLDDAFARHAAVEMYAAAVVEVERESGAVDREVLERLRSLYRPALVWARHHTGKLLAFITMLNLASVLVRSGEPDEALERMREALRMPAWRRVPPSHPKVLWLQAAMVAAAVGRHEEGAQLLGLTHAQFTEQRESPLPLVRRDLHDTEARLRAALGPEAWGAAVRTGAALSFDEATSLVLGLEAAGVSRVEPRIVS